MLGGLFALIWWGVVLGAALQTWRAWGAAPALGAVVGLLVASWILPFGGLLTCIGAVAIGAGAEGARGRLTG